MRRRAGSGLAAALALAAGVAGASAAAVGAPGCGGDGGAALRRAADRFCRGEAQAARRMAESSDLLAEVAGARDPMGPLHRAAAFCAEARGATLEAMRRFDGITVEAQTFDATFKTDPAAATAALTRLATLFEELVALPPAD